MSIDQMRDRFASIPPGLAPCPISTAQPGEVLHDLFAEAALRWPAHIALRLADPDPEVSRRAFLTYGELDARAERFAGYLASRGVGTGDRVAICLPRGLDQYWALLGVLKAGAAYVPIDWNAPHERIAYIFADSGACAAITFGSTHSAALGDPAAVIDIEAELGDIAAI